MPSTALRRGRRKRTTRVSKRKPRTMTNPVEQLSLIDEIDRRQNEVLDRLDELNEQVESLLKKCLPAKEDSEA